MQNDENKKPQGPDVKGDAKEATVETRQNSADEKMLDEHQKVVASAEEMACENDVPSIEETLRNDLADTKDRLLRLAADFENYKKITQREQQNTLKFANEGLISNLLPVVDNLEQAISACKKSSEANNDVLIGVEMVVKQLNEVLKKAGVEIFSALGKPFDPARHEAMGEQPDENAEDGTVVVEYQKGYLLHNRLLRPARVVIARRSGK